ncbi:hypothetical protein GGH96_005320 [Coemansia sp. RSA 1972]|nr:hypothetical protein GGH96_005320 [Coemansia sp. RSA 1972]
MKFCAATALMLAGHAAAYDILRASKLNCREKPTTNSDLVKVYELGDNIDIVCQTNGQKQMGSTVWDMTPDGCYVLDYYLYTGYSGIFMPLCKDMESGVSAKPSQSASGSSVKPSQSESKDSKTSGSEDNESVSESGALGNIDSEESEKSEEGTDSLANDSELGEDSEDDKESEDSDNDSDESETSNAMSLANGSCALIVAGLIASLL